MSRRSDLLVETDWLAEHLHDSDLRILECTVYLHPADVPGGYRVESGRGRWEQGHIPGAGFADLPDHLSDRSSPLRFTLPPADQFADAMGRYGVGPGVRVVLYDRFVNTLETSRRQELHVDMLKMAAEDVPMIPTLYPVNYPTAVRAGVRGPTPLPPVQVVTTWNIHAWDMD